jgi:ribonuclease HII
MPNFNEELMLLDTGYDLVAGLDEAGRGPLAGPVVAACVLYREKININNSELKYVDDSKKLTPLNREKLFELIKNNFEIGIGICDHNTIDKINILQATFLAMKKAIGALKNKPDFLLVDGNKPIPNISVKQKTIIRGDGKVFLIAAASIIAKVTRDRIMDEYHCEYPKFNFEKNKGYGTKEHMEAIYNSGPCLIHRKTFEPIKSLIAKRFFVKKLTN